MNLDECAMNPKEIDAIKDINIKNIKRKYWDLKHKAFLDEHNIADTEIDNVYDSLTQKERKELEEYYNTL